MKADSPPQKDAFLQLPSEDIVARARRAGRPQLGVFVPDGSRRLVLAYSDAEPGSAKFDRLSATLPAEFVMQSLRVFFDYGLPILLVPILGQSILKRGQSYQKNTLFEGLHLLFNSQAFLQFYDRHDVQVKVYGHLNHLIGTVCEPALAWIDKTCQATARHSTHKLFYAIGESPIVGEEAACSAVAYYMKHGRSPTLHEQIEDYYGEILPPADFFIMTSKMGGMGALPNLLVNGDTELYYLPTVMGLTESNYRRILYDLLYGRAPLRSGIADFEITPENRQALRQAYEQSREQVVGLGFSIGKIWVMNDPAKPSSERHEF